MQALAGVFDKIESGGDGLVLEIDDNIDIIVETHSSRRRRAVNPKTPATRVAILRKLFAQTLDAGADFRQPGVLSLFERQQLGHFAPLHVHDGIRSGNYHFPTSERKNSRSLFSSASTSLISHSQTIIARHPSAASLDAFASSRARLRAILACQ